MGGISSKYKDYPKDETLEAPPGCWWYQRGPVAYGTDCNCHKTAPRRCNPGPPPFPDSMAEWMGLPPPTRRELRPEEAKWQRFFAHVPNPYPMLDEKTLQARGEPDFTMMSNFSPENYTEIEIKLQNSENTKKPEDTISNQEESTDPSPNSHWGPVPFNGLAPPVEALMPDELGHRSFVRSTQYNRQLEAFLFNGDDVQHAVWHSNKHMPFKPHLTLYRLWSDNYTYVADWDPRVVLNLLSGSILYQIVTPQHEDRLGMVFKLMPARHIYALQHCAMRSAELTAENVQQVLAGAQDASHAESMAYRMTPWMVYLFEMYQLWKDITGLDVARKKSGGVAPTKRSSDGNSDPYSNKLYPSGGKPSKGEYKWNDWEKGQGKPIQMPDWRNPWDKDYGQPIDATKYETFVIPWYESPYNPKVDAEKYKHKPTYQPWESPVPAIVQPTDVPWNSICEDVLVAAKRWRSINKNHKEFLPNFYDILKAWEILGPKLEKLGHGERLKRMSRILSWQAERQYEFFMIQPWLDMCSWVKPYELCVTTAHAMYMLMVAIRQQIEPVYWDL